MKDTKSMDVFYTWVIGLINQLKHHGENIEEINVVEKVLISLSQNIESLITTLEENKSQFTIDELQASLINHEHRINRSNTSLEGTFITLYPIL